MSASIIVYGPQGCGKTRNAEKIRAALGCKCVIEGEDLVAGRAFPTSGALILTNDPHFIAPLGVHRLPFAQAMRQVRLAKKECKAGAA